MSTLFSKIVRNVRNNLIAGLLVMVPVGVTFVAFTMLFENVDEILGPRLHSLLVRMFPRVFVERIPGLGVIATLLLLYIAGFLTRSYLGTKVIGLWDGFIRKVPLFGAINKAASQLMSTVASPRQLRRVVMVQFPNPGSYMIGFVTGQSNVDGMEIRNHVFVPTAPLPTAGFLMLLKPEEIIESDLSIEEAMKMIVSAGLVHPGTQSTLPERPRASYQAGRILALKLTTVRVVSLPTEWRVTPRGGNRGNDRLMKTRLHLEILRQPDDATCGPTCLHAVYRYYGEEVALDDVVAEVPSLEGGGTLAVHMACHALRRGYAATIFTFNLRVFDPTWFAPNGPDLKKRLVAQMETKKISRISKATAAYLEFLSLGGHLRFQDLTRGMIRNYLNRGVPILTGLSATYLYRCAREFGSGSKLDFDDVRGEPMGHFVVLCGYDKRKREVLVADPYFQNPIAQDRIYQVNIDRLVCSILLGVLTHDANLLIIEPLKKTPPKTSASSRERP